MLNTKYLFAALTSLLIISLSTYAHQGHQFRSLNLIATDKNAKEALPDRAISLQDKKEFSRSEVEPLVRDVIEKWNTSGMASTLSEQFYDKSRLLDVMDTSVPRDAKLRIDAVQGIQTLEQYKVAAENGRDNIVSIVSATVRTQLEFNSTTGFQRRVGTNEFILKITTPAPLER